jgi:hypothetical protein
MSGDTAVPLVPLPGEGRFPVPSETVVFAAQVAEPPVVWSAALQYENATEP